MYRVLIVDDNPLTLKLHVQLMESLGCEVRGESDGAAIEEIARAFKPDIAFLDVRLAHESGLEVGRRLRPLMQGGRIFALTALPPASIEAEAGQAGFAGVLRKPCPVQTFIDILHPDRQPARG
ncbi:putative transcriptional regulator [mine drainage metagenome]|uniref:Putative transcriptional regulator n=1 Tax=mine drainage metagenome TaxID=410659 RepID=A0A1J5S8E7_9ZZZZ